MTEGETVSDLLWELAGDPDTSVGTAWMRHLLDGDADESALDYEDWVRPCKLSGGRVCLRESLGNGDEVYYSIEGGDTLHAVAVRENNRVPVRNGEAVSWLRAAPVSTLRPVLRERTPFADDDGVLE